MCSDQVRRIRRNSVHRSDETPSTRGYPRFFVASRAEGGSKSSSRSNSLGSSPSIPSNSVEKSSAIESNSSTIPSNSLNASNSPPFPSNSPPFPSNSSPTSSADSPENGWVSPFPSFRGAGAPRVLLVGHRLVLLSPRSLPETPARAPVPRALPHWQKFGRNSPGPEGVSEPVPASPAGTRADSQPHPLVAVAAVLPERFHVSTIPRSRFPGSSAAPKRSRAPREPF